MRNEQTNKRTNEQTNQPNKWTEQMNERSSCTLLRKHYTMICTLAESTTQRNSETSVVPWWVRVTRTTLQKRPPPPRLWNWPSTPRSLRYHINPNINPLTPRSWRYHMNPNTNHLSPRSWRYHMNPNTNPLSPRSLRYHINPNTNPLLQLPPL